MVELSPSALHAIEFSNGGRFDVPTKSATATVTALSVWEWVRGIQTPLVLCRVADEGVTELEDQSPPSWRKANAFRARYATPRIVGCNSSATQNLEPRSVSQTAVWPWSWGWHGDAGRRARLRGVRRSGTSALWVARLPRSICAL